jgi:hypothetical protein
MKRQILDKKIRLGSKPSLKYRSEKFTQIVTIWVNFSERFEVRDEDVERLSPLTSHHINFVGKYHFSLPDEVKRGELRPFHNPDDMTNII